MFLSSSNRSCGVKLLVDKGTVNVCMCVCVCVCVCVCFIYIIGTHSISPSLPVSSALAGCDDLMSSVLEFGKNLWSWIRAETVCAVWGVCVCVCVCVCLSVCVCVCVCVCMCFSWRSWLSMFWCCQNGVRFPREPASKQWNRCHNMVTSCNYAHSPTHTHMHTHTHTHKQK